MSTAVKRVVSKSVRKRIGVQTRGKCRYCSCTKFNACVVPTRLSSGRMILAGCAWADKKQTVCTNPDCLAQAEKDGIELLDECRRAA